MTKIKPQLEACFPSFVEFDNKQAISVKMEGQIWATNETQGVILWDSVLSVTRRFVYGKQRKQLTFLSH